MPALIFAVLLPSCVIGCNQRSPATLKAKSVTISPLPLQRLSPRELERSREWWHLTTEVVSGTADSAHGVSFGLSEKPDDQATREYYAVPETVNESDLRSSKYPIPKGWDDVRVAVLETVTATNENVALIQRAHDGDEDAAREAIHQAERVKISFCSALLKARRHYVAAGGRANDLTIFYLSDTADIPCTLVNDRKRTRGIVLRATVGIDSFETFSGVGGHNANVSESQNNIIHDMGARLTVGTLVTVFEHRRSFDEDPPIELCRSSVPSRSKQYWFLCNDIRANGNL